MPPKKILKKPPTVQKNVEQTVETIDYLTEDPTITGQKFVCVSFLKPSQFEEKYRPKDLSVCGFKVRGSFDTYEEAQKRCDYLRSIDDKHNIYIAEVGKWCPFEDNPEKAKDSEYMNKDLNKLMKNYWKQQEDAKQFHEIRKQEMVAKALKEVEQRKQENSELANGTSNENESSNNGENLNETSVQTGKSKKSKKNKKTDKSAKLEEMKNELSGDKKDLEHDKKEIDENINTLRRLEEELAQKIKEMEAEGALPQQLNKVNLA